MKTKIYLTATISLFVVVFGALTTHALSGRILDRGAGTVRGVGTAALIGGDLTDPENNGDPENNVNYNATFNASEEPNFGGSQGAFNVFDNLVGGGNDKFCCGDQNQFPANPITVDATFPTSIVLSRFTVASGDDAPDRDPRVWQIQGSNDGVHFTTIYARNDTTASVWTARNQVVEFRAGEDFNLPPAYTTIRFITTATNLTSGARFQISEIEYFNTPTETPSLVVTTSNDTLNAFDNQTSLREAINYANSLSGALTITFAPSLAGQTVMLSNGWNNASDTAALRVSGNLSIQGPTSGAGITVAIANGVQKRHLFVESSGTLSISNLTLTNGYAPDTYGGSIWSFGALTVRRCTFTNNYATGEAGAIQGWSGSPSLLVENSTFSGNSSGGIAGAIDAGATQITLRNLTITGNTSATSSGALVIYQTQATLSNTIVAGNTGGDIGTANGGGFDAQSLNNLIGTGGSGGLQNNVNGNQVGVANPQLLPLADNGGGTRTHALLPNSPAVNAGTATNAPPTDQRGKARVGNVDIGAFEAPANLVVINTGNAAGSLREAITTANASAADESITFAIPATDAGCVSGVCTINLGGTQLTIDNASTAGSLLIQNTSGTAANLRVSGNNSSRVFNIASGADVTMGSLTVTGGRTAISQTNGGGINNAGTLALTNVEVTGNSVTSNSNGGGIANNGTLNLTNSSVLNNSATNVGGGIAALGGTINITNSTISGNSIGNSGGGIYIANGTVNITNSTVTNNSTGGNSGGIRAVGVLNSRNSIFSGNTNQDVVGTLNSQGYNLIGDTTNTTINGDTTGNILNQDARLAPLGYYGGETMTHALLSGSPAINAGTATGAPATDQRGAARVGAVDIGAFELNNSANGGNFSSPLPNATQNSAYTFALVPNNSPNGTPFTYTQTGGTLPNGLSITTTNGVVTLSGTPTQSGAFNFSITASDGANSNVTAYTLQVIPSFYTISGQVTWNGNPLSGVTITLSGSSTASTSTDTNGNYSLPNLAAGGNYTVTPSLPHYTFAPASQSFNNLSANQTQNFAATYIPPNAAARDARAPRPASGTSTALFTVTLSFPPAAVTTVNFATADDSTGAHPASGGASCGAGVDYLTTSSTITFQPGESLKTIPVTLCGGAAGNFDKTLLVNLSTPTNTTLERAQAVGTITPTSSPSALLISELRTAGPNGANDQFIELYNNSDAPLTIAASDTSSGYGLFAMGATCAATPVLIGVVPNGTSIPARGHYLLTGSGYSLAAMTSGNQTLSAPLAADGNVALFTTASLLNLSTTAWLDAVGFGSNTGANCDLLREGATLTPASGSASQHSFVRQVKAGGAGAGKPVDTNDNLADFVLVSTDAALLGGAQSILGAPGPENLSSPLFRDDKVTPSYTDPLACRDCLPNRERNGSGNSGTLTIRRHFTNNTGALVTRLRFRVIDITTLGSPVVTPPQAQLTLSNSTDQNVSTSMGQVLVKGTQIEQPNQALGGGLNTSLSVVLPGGGLSPGSSIDVQWLMQVAQNGRFRFFVTVEALP